MSKRLLWYLLVLSFAPFVAFGQSSGKIVGVITDAETGEALPGVNVSLDGTTYGAATDVDGYYVILNVPVGTYDVRANFIGYGDKLYTGVRVSANVTTEQNFELAEAVIEGEAVVVTARKPLVEKNVTQSISLVTSEELENIPVRGFNEVMALQNSVVVQDDEVYIRGGRSDEVGYYLDGASSMSVVNNTQAVHIIQEAVEEFQVLAGGYTAEFGNANSGIIRTELRTGTSQYNASIDFQTDNFATEGEQFLGTYSYGHTNTVATLSGPLFSNKIRFFFAGENTYEKDRDVRFSEGFEFRGLVDTEPLNPQNNPGSNNFGPDTVDLVYPDGFTPNRSFERWALNGTLLFDYQPIRLRLSGVYKNENFEFPAMNTDAVGGGTRAPMLAVNNTRGQYDEDVSVLLGAKLTHVLSPKTLYSVRFNYFQSRLERFDDLMGNDWTSWYDSAAVHQASDGRYVYRDEYRPQYNYQLQGMPFARDGSPPVFYRIAKEQYWGGALDFTSQIGRHHELKIGGDFRQFEMRRYQVNAGAISVIGTNDDWNSFADVPGNAFAAQGRPNHYGYDFKGNEIDDGFDAPRKPLFAAFYIQDKIEYNDLIINVGLRFDHFDTDDRKLINPEEPEIDGNFVDESAWEDVDPFQQISPRLGLSFPVSERTVFYLQYGKFLQMTELNNIYFGTQEYGRQIAVGGNYFINPVGFGLEPTKTTSYEMGFRQQISDVAAFDIAGFYRNVRGQVQVGRQNVNPTAGITAYDILINGDFATTKGMDFKLTMRRTNRLQAQLNYTYTNAEGTGSNETSYRSALYLGTQTPTTVNPLDFSQSHTGALNLDYRFNKGDGGPILENLGANVLFTFSSGHPFTFANPQVGGQSDAYTAGIDYELDTRSRVAAEQLNASTTPWNFLTDLRLDKWFNLTEGLRANVYMRVNNLFNSQNVINVYQATGNASDDGFLSNPERSGATIAANGGEDYVNLYKALNLENGQAYWDQIGQELYGHPRQIFFGIKLSY